MMNNGKIKKLYDIGLYCSTHLIHLIKYSLKIDTNFLIYIYIKSQTTSTQ